MKSSSENQTILEVLIERIVPDGYGIAFANNLTVFVPLVAAGDRVKVCVERQKGRVAFASLIEILEESPDRVNPPCPYFGRCGGCDFQQMNYAAQLQAKLNIIKDCLRRIGKIDWQNNIEIVAAPSQWNYRTRVQWKYDAKNNNFGYFERSSHRVLDVATCPILNDVLENELNAWREKAKSKNAKFSEIHLVSNETEVSFKFDHKDEILGENFYAANKEIEDKTQRASESDNAKIKEISFKVNEFEYSFDANAFFQVNHQMLPQFVKEAIGETEGQLALDLYCGVGLFALPLAKKFEQVIGIEGNQQSINFANKNAAQANLKNVNFVISAVAEWLIKTAASLPRVDLVLLDPPRTGAEPETIDSLLVLRPQKIVYVSCNPATLARDLLLLTENIYETTQITAFDFFPQTHHVETVVHLNKIVKSTKPCESILNLANKSTKPCEREKQ